MEDIKFWCPVEYNILLISNQWLDESAWNVVVPGRWFHPHQNRKQNGHSSVWVMVVLLFCYCAYPDSKVHGANMGPTWVRQDPGGPHVGPMNFAIWVYIEISRILRDVHVRRLVMWRTPAMNGFSLNTQNFLNVMLISKWVCVQAVQSEKIHHRCQVHAHRFQ